MSESLSLPRRTSYITLENSQGTLDPLGLYSIADRLATRLAPGLRERMKRPRYLTASAVSAVVCSAFEEEVLATDGISAPWQVFEWYVASALVKKYEKGDPEKQLLGMPGREKTTTCMRENVPLNANRYLKTPAVFGFHGVYRTLAKNMHLVEGHLPGEFGLKLVDVWEQEQELKGFRAGEKGTRGADFRGKLQEGVEKGLKEAAVAKPWSWEPFGLLAVSLAPRSPGRGEASLLLEELKKGNDGVRHELIGQLSSREGQRLLEMGSERRFHSWMVKNNNGDVPLLKAILAYEKFCRLLHNAFYSVLSYMESHSCKADLTELSNDGYVQRAAERIPNALSDLEEKLEPFTEEASIIQANFNQFSEKLNFKGWVKLLFEHHFSVQRNKQPAKAAWVLEHDSDSYLLNTSQAEEPGGDEYVHQYRTFPLASFLNDLGGFS